MLLMIDNYDSFTFNGSSIWPSWVQTFMSIGMTRLVLMSG